MEESVSFMKCFPFFLPPFHPRDYKYLILLLHYLPILFFEAFICWVFPLRTIFHLNTCVCCCEFIRGSIRSVQKGKRSARLWTDFFFSLLTLCSVHFCGLLLWCCKVFVVGSRHHKYRQCSERDFISDWKIHSIRIICQRISRRLPVIYWNFQIILFRTLFRIAREWMEFLTQYYEDIYENFFNRLNFWWQVSLKSFRLKFDESKIKVSKSF